MTIVFKEGDRVIYKGNTERRPYNKEYVGRIGTVREAYGFGQSRILWDGTSDKRSLPVHYNINLEFIELEILGDDDSDCV